MIDYTDLIERLRGDGPIPFGACEEAADAIIALEEHVDALSAQIVADTTDKDYWKARVKLLEDAMKYIFEETQNTGYGNAIVMERMIDRIEECAIYALSNLAGDK